MKRYLPVLIGSGLLVAGITSSPVYAEDLIQVYGQALANDPLYAQAVSTWHSQKMNLPIARAGYLPQLQLTASALRQYQQLNPTFAPNFSGSNIGNGNGYSWQYGYTLTATQPIFNYAVWHQITGASANVKAATANFLSAQQSLMQRTASAYFAVLKAYDQLRYTIANKRAVWEQFVTAREQFRVGLIAITDEYDARARYDQVVALEIANLNNLNIQLENLRAITKHSYQSLKGLGKLPLITPQPNNIDTWVSISNKQNYSIQAQNFSVIAAMEAIKQATGAGLPSVGLTGSVGEQHETDGNPDSTLDSADVGLQLAYNPIQGGLVVATTKQARYNYVTAAGLLEQTHRTVVNQARSSFLSILSDISRVKADKQTMMSTQNAFEATEAGLKVGTRTMVDVLNSLTSVYQSQQQYANDQYSYLNDLINLKYAAGTLSEKDLAAINSWLGKPIHFPSQLSVAKVPADNSHELVNVNAAGSNTGGNTLVKPKDDAAVASTTVEPSSSISTSTTTKTTSEPKSATTSVIIPAPSASPRLTPMPAPTSTATPTPGYTFIPAPAPTIKS